MKNKDKRIYLKIACILEVIYIILSLIYYVFYLKNKDEIIAKVFLTIISSFITIILYKESKKDIEEIKKNRSKVIISSIWLLFEPVIPGILGLMFINSLKPKKEVKLPVIKEENRSIKTYIKSFFLIFTFIFCMFLLPHIKFLRKIPGYFIYIFIFLIVLIINIKELKNNFKIFISNFKKYFPFIIKRYFQMLLLMIIVALPIVLINKGNTSVNQELINNMFKVMPFWTFILSTLYAPIVEENVFRLSLSKFFSNKTLFIIISGFLFGSLHVIDKFTTLYDLLYIFQYSVLGMCLAKAYKDTNNIWVSISMHFIQNFLAAVLVLIIK